jgi:hypothetical protein
LEKITNIYVKNKGGKNMGMGLLRILDEIEKDIFYDDEEE